MPGLECSHFDREMCQDGNVLMLTGAMCRDWNVSHFDREMCQDGNVLMLTGATCRDWNVLILIGRCARMGMFSC